MPFQVRVLGVFNRFYHNCATLGPYKMQVARMDDHAIFVSGVKADRSTYPEMCRRRYDRFLLLSLNHLFQIKISTYN